ncbi:MAG: SH3 domain-containing protein [Anaerolineae bacterium]
MRSSGRALALSLLVFVMFLSACTPTMPGGKPIGTILVPPSTFTAIPTFTAAPATSTPVLPTVAPTVAQETAVGTLYVTVSADNVNLRTRPGTTFPVSRLLAKGTRLQLLGHTPGGEWLYVQTDSNVQGYILSWLVEGGHDGGKTPEVQPGDVQVVRGRVVDRAGVPVSGIGFAVTQGTGPKAPRADATTDENGMFYAFLPQTATGTWLVSYASVACTSNTMDASCNCIGTCGTADPTSRPVTLPSDEILQFVWR